MDPKTRKAAVLVSSLDPQSADALLEKMSPEQAQRVRNAIMQLDDISSIEEQAVLSDFLQRGPADAPPEADTDGVELEGSLAMRLGQPPAEQRVQISESGEGAAKSGPFSFLQSASTELLAEHLGREHPQVIAVVAAHLPPFRAAELIKQLPPALQADVLRRVADSDGTDPEVLEEIDHQLEEALADQVRASENRVTGLHTAAAILAAAGEGREQMWENVQDHDRSLAGMLREGEEPADSLPDGQPVVTPATVAAVDSDRPDTSTETAAVVDEPVPAHPDVGEPPADLSRLLEFPKEQLVHLTAAMPDDILLLALAGASPDVAERLLSTFNGRQARSIRGQLTRLGPLRLADIAHAQRRLMAEAGELLAQGLLGQVTSRFSHAA